MTARTIRETFPKKLLFYMAENQKSRNDLVRDLGLKYSTVRDWEKGLTVPRMDKVEALANYFHCTTADLLEDREDKPTTMQDDGLREDVKQFAAFLESCSEEETRALLAMSQAFLANLRAGSFSHPEEDSKKTR